MGQTVASLVMPGAPAPLVGTALDRLLAARTRPPRRLEAALQEVAEAVLEFAPDLPAVRLEFMREVLRRLPPVAGGTGAI